MGTPLNDSALAPASGAKIYEFFTSASWIEGAALDQLRNVAALEGISHVVAFPDLHPGKYGPVGCSILSDRIYPQLIGNDIGCGMSLFVLDVPARKLRLDKVAERLRVLEGPFDGDASAYLEQHDLCGSLFSESIGTIGGGNHFCEVQSVAEMFDEEASNSAGIDPRQAVLLVHSGSRSFGMSVFMSVQDSFQQGLASGSHELQSYFQEHDRAVKWASLNRFIIATRAATALRAECLLVADAPHNIIEAYQGGYLHRKGAAVANIPFVPLAGSRDALSFLVKPTENKQLKDNSLCSLAHGAGRKYDRKSMKGRIGTKKSNYEGLKRTSFGGQVICDDRQLLIEEAPLAYKKPEIVLNDLIKSELVSAVLSLKPLVTFKKAISKKKSTRCKYTKHRPNKRGLR